MTESFLILSSDDDPSVQTLDGVAMATERGQMYQEKDRSNQDRVASGLRIFDGKEYRVHMVCDGLGGYGDHDGDKAAHALCESLQDTFEELESFPEDVSKGIVEPLLAKTVERFEELGMDSESGGTTFMLAVETPEEIQVFHLGDSPAFFFQLDGSFVNRTTDHKPMDFLNRFKLTHYVHQVAPDFPLEEPDQMTVSKSDYPEGFILVLCSDGISDNLMTSATDRQCHPQITSLITEHGSDPKILCEQLMKVTKERMALSGTEEGKELDVKPDNSACLVRSIGSL